MEFNPRDYCNLDEMIHTSSSASAVLEDMHAIFFAPQRDSLSENETQFAIRLFTAIRSGCLTADLMKLRREFFADGSVNTNGDCCANRIYNLSLKLMHNKADMKQTAVLQDVREGQRRTRKDTRDLPQEQSIGELVKKINDTSYELATLEARRVEISSVLSFLTLNSLEALERRKAGVSQEFDDIQKKMERIIALSSRSISSTRVKLEHICSDAAREFDVAARAIACEAATVAAPESSSVADTAAIPTEEQVPL